MKSSIDTSENMKTNYYTIDIKIYNDFGELAEKKLLFPTLKDMSITMWTKDVVDGIISDAEGYAKENNMVIEEMSDSKEDAVVNEEYIEDLSESSPLNNPDNFAN